MLRTFALTLIFILSSSSLFASLPHMGINFGGPLAKSCSFVDNEDVIASLQSTISVLERIQEVESECRNILVNSKAFMKSSLSNAIAMQTELAISESNYSVLKEFIENKIDAGESYSGEYDSEILAVQKEIAKLNDDNYLTQVSAAQTMQLGISLFNDLNHSPAACSISFAQDLLAPAIAVSASVVGTVRPDIGLAAGLLSSIIEYGSRVMSDSYQSLKSLQNSKNFHMTYKCTMKNIEDIICSLEEQENAIRSSQDISSDNEFMYDYYNKILDYDTADGDFRIFHHLKRHRYRISKILEDLDNIYRSPETANDLKTVISYQTGFTGLGLIPKLNPLKSAAYVEGMIKAGHVRPGQIVPNWSVWDNNIASWGSLSSSFYREPFYSLINNYCKKIDLEQFPELKGIYSPQQQSCQFKRLREEKVITSFFNNIIVRSLVFLQGESVRINEKIKNNANIHGLYLNIQDQEHNVGHNDYNEYSLSELLDLYIRHSESNLDTSLKLYAEDMIKTMQSIYPLIEVADGRNGISSFDSFVDSTKVAYSEIAKVSNNGAEGGVLYRSIVESKISSYLDGVNNNYLFNSDSELSQSYVNFNFHVQHFERLTRESDNAGSAGSSNLSVMKDVRSAFLDTFGDTITTVMSKNIKKYKSDKLLKRELIHSCAIFAPQFGKFKNKFGMHASDFEYGKPFALSKRDRVQKFCYKLLKKEKGIFFTLNSTKKFPLKLESGLNYKDRCYYKKYETEVIRFRIKNAKKNSTMLRI